MFVFVEYINVQLVALLWIDEASIPNTRQFFCWSIARDFQNNYTLPSLELTYPLKIGAPFSKGDSELGNHDFSGANENSFRECIHIANPSYLAINEPHDIAAATPTALWFSETISTAPRLHRFVLLCDAAASTRREGCSTVGFDQSK